MQPHSTESAGPQSAEAVYLGKVADKSSPAAAYSSHIAADWSTVTKSSQGNGKASAAASLYLTASDSENEADMVYDAVSLQDSDKDFQIEGGSECANTQLAGVATEEDVQQAAAPVVLFQGAGLKSSSAAVVSSRKDEEFDYAFNHGPREGVSYERIFKPQPMPAHLTSHHPAHLTSLAEDSEEGSDAVSESEGGLIQDDDLPTPSLAPSASLDHSQGSKVTRSSTAASTVVQAAHKERAAAGTDGMYELDINDDLEQASGLNSFTAKAGQRLSQHATVPKSGMQLDNSRSGAGKKEEQQAAGSSTDDNAAAKTAGGFSADNHGAAPAPAAAGISANDHNAAAAAGSSNAALQTYGSTAEHLNPSPELSQQAKSIELQPLPDSVPAAALSQVPILGQQAAAAAHAVGSQPKAAAAGALAGIDLEEVELQDAVASVSADGKAEAGKAATDEWEEVNLARAKELAVDAPTAAIPGDKVRYPEALNHFLSADVKAIKKTLKKSKPVHRLASCFMRMQKSSKRLEKERTRLMCLAKMQFDDNDIMHLRLLQSVYLNFVGGPGPIGRYGPHWSTLGFQGSDPTTDLRGCGVLGLLHLLLLHEHDPSNAQAIFRLASAADSEFPLAPVSLNITKWALQMVRDRKLSSAAKKQQSAVTATSDFYIGTFYAFYNHWKDKKCTMADSGFVLKDLEKRATRDVMNMVKRAGTKL